MTTVSVAEYWPFFLDTKIRQFCYTSTTGGAPFTTNFYFDPCHSSMIQENYDAAGSFLNKWYMQIRANFGVAEWRDDTPGKVIVFSEPIGWGNVQEVPGNYINHPVTDPFQCIPLMAAKATQSVNFEAFLPTFELSNGTIYSDVLQFAYLQFWGSHASGARYWNAKGVGPVAVQFIIQNGDGTWTVTDRWDATVNEIIREKAVADPEPVA